MLARLVLSPVEVVVPVAVDVHVPFPPDLGSSSTGLTSCPGKVCQSLHLVPGSSAMVHPTDEEQRAEKILVAAPEVRVEILAYPHLLRDHPPACLLLVVLQAGTTLANLAWVDMSVVLVAAVAGDDWLVVSVDAVV